MENKETRQQKIEDYLQNQLSQSEREEFEKEITKDPQLREEIALHHLIQDEIGDEAKQSFIHNMQSLSDEFFTSPGKVKKRNILGYYILGMAILVILALLAWRLVTYSKETPSNMEQSEPAGHPDLETTQQRPNIPLAIEESGETDMEQVASNTQIGDSPSAPLALSDPESFKPHPYLHDLLDRELRADQIQISVIAEIRNRTILLLQGEIKSVDYNEEDRFALWIYSNRAEDYEYGNYLVKESIVLSRVETGGKEFSPSGKEIHQLAFNLEMEVSFAPGWYYYFIALEEEEEPLFVDRFILDQ